MSLFLFLLSPPHLPPLRQILVLFPNPARDNLAPSRRCRRFVLSRRNTIFIQNPVKLEHGVCYWRPPHSRTTRRSLEQNECARWIATRFNIPPFFLCFFGFFFGGEGIALPRSPPPTHTHTDPSALGTFSAVLCCVRCVGLLITRASLWSCRASLARSPQTPRGFAPSCGTAAFSRTSGSERSRRSAGGARLRHRLLRGPTRQQTRSRTGPHRTSSSPASTGRRSGWGGHFLTPA